MHIATSRAAIPGWRSCANSSWTSRLVRGPTGGLRETVMRKRVLACVIGVAGALWLVPSASADTATIGAAAPSTDVLFGGAQDFTALQQTTDPVSPSFVVPPVPAGGGPWSVTSWSALGGTGDG